jgi:hypothetical protein
MLNDINVSHYIILIFMRCLLTLFSEDESFKYYFRFIRYYFLVTY